MLRRREALAFYVFTLPALIGLLGYWGGPIIASVGLSFFKYNALQPPVWAGLGNFQQLATDNAFPKVMGATLYYVAGSVPLATGTAFLLAALLNQKVHGIYLFRALFYIPAVVSTVAVAIIWIWVYHPSFGLLNMALDNIGIRGPEWLGSTKWAMPAMIIMSMWGVGTSMIIFLAGFQGIPEHLYEAAVIDGANWFAKFRNVTIPMMTPIIFFLAVVNTIAAFQSFPFFYIMTAGGPGLTTMVMPLYLYNKAFEQLYFGYASAIALVLFLMILIATIIQFWGARRWVYYESGTADGGI